MTDDDRRREVLERHLRAANDELYAAGLRLMPVSARSLLVLSDGVWPRAVLDMSGEEQHDPSEG